MNQFRLYIRQAHVVMQLFVLIGLTLLGLGLMSSMGLLAAETFFQADIETINTYIQNPSLPGAVAPLKLLQICTTIGIFLLPAMAFSQFLQQPARTFPATESHTCIADCFSNRGTHHWFYTHY
jgi:hypothetical protein